MKISLNWINEFIENPQKIDPNELALLFTAKTAEVEGVDEQAKKFDHMVVGQIKEIQPHPNADKLRITKTDIGTQTLQIICGASNIYVGQFVPVALIGAKVRWHGEGELVTLEEAKIRGIESYGMICAAEEIGLSDEKSEGILDLKDFQPKVGMPLAEAVGQDDTILTVDNKSLTHRPDLWGHYGIAREVAAITHTRLKPKNIQVDLPTNGIAPNIEIKAKKLCSRYLGIQIENIQIGPSPEWLQKKLRAVGQKPINNIVDVTNYVMLEIGQPMHAFDAEKIVGGIIIRNAKKNEKITTLDSTDRQLNENMLVIADHQKPVAIAGIMGGSTSEISSTTTKIFLESATFNPSSVRKTSVQLGLRTEAVQRFEKSLDPHLAHKAILRACQYILQICPSAKISGPLVDLKNWKEKTLQVTVDLKKVFSKIGKEISIEDVKKMLESLEFKVELKGSKKIKVIIPSFRATKDISIEDDLVEEIARLYGYENIEAKLPELPTKLPMENHERKLKHRARQILSWGLGFDEVYNYSFYSLKDIQKSLLPEELHVKIQNYLSEDQTHLRVSLVPNLLKNVAHNLKYHEGFKIYEIGRTYHDLQEYFPIEEKKICGVIVRNKKATQKQSSDGTVGNDIFYEAKGAVEAFLKAMNINCFRSDKNQTYCPYAHPSRALEYLSAGFCFDERKSVQNSANNLLEDEFSFARVFELHPLIAKNYDLENASIAIFEINFTRLAQMPTRELKYRPLPKFPEIEIDISVVIDDRTEIGGIQKTIQDSDHTLIQSVRLFDLYQGPNISEGKKALAFKVLLQSPDRTLTDEEMKKVQNAIFEKLLSLGGEIRGLNK